jgi:hypothetical protein
VGTTIVVTLLVLLAVGIVVNPARSAQKVSEKTT